MSRCVSERPWRTMVCSPRSVTLSQPHRESFFSARPSRRSTSPASVMRLSVRSTCSRRGQCFAIAATPASPTFWCWRSSMWRSAPHPSASARTPSSVNK
eukprot:scaffold62599_cov66-Phaeocystis_antarctica.AAC.2